MRAVQAEDGAPWRHDPTPTRGPRPKGGARCRPVFPFQDWHERGKSFDADKSSLPNLPTRETPFHAEPSQTQARHALSRGLRAHRARHEKITIAFGRGSEDNPDSPGRVGSDPDSSRGDVLERRPSMPGRGRPVRVGFAGPFGLRISQGRSRMTFPCPARHADTSITPSGPRSGRRPSAAGAGRPGWSRRPWNPPARRAGHRP